MAITKYDQFDFLIDIVPRDDIKPNKIRDDGTRTSTNPDQVSLLCVEIESYQNKRFKDVHNKIILSSSPFYLFLQQVHYYFQLAQQHHANLQQNNSSGTTSTTNTVAQPQGTIQIVQPQQVQTVQVNTLDQVSRK